MEEEKIYGRIYGIECLINHKIYVGQTIRPVEERIREHKHAKNSLGEDIRQYGWENFVWVVLEECTSKKQLDEAEKSWIARLDCMEPNGYNRNSGGWGGSIPSLESRERMSAANKGRKRSAKLVAELIERNMGNQYRTGQKNSIEQCEKISAANIGKQRTLGISKDDNAKKQISDGVQNYWANRDNWQYTYPVLEAELKALQITHTELARLVGMNRVTLVNKLNGRNNLYEKEKRAIKESLGLEMPLEVLFAKIDKSEEPAYATTKTEIVYPNLHAEMIKRNLTYSEIARHLKVSPQTISRKLKGIGKMDEKTALAIRELLGVETPLEILFAREDG